jgi:hypothetical protein
MNLKQQLEMEQKYLENQQKAREQELKQRHSENLMKIAALVGEIYAEQMTRVLFVGLMREKWRPE